MIPDIGIWRAASLMLKSSAANEGDHDGAAIWRLITDAVAQLANTTPSGPVH